MNAKDRIKERLRPVKLYSTDEGTLQDAEISAYAKGIEILDEALEELLRECFAQTAEGFGIERMERLWGRVRDELSVMKRREMLIARNSLKTDDFTPEGFEKIFALLGVSGQITEYPSLNRVVISITDKEYTAGERAFISSQCEALFPAHLETDLVFLGFPWKLFEEKGYDFLSIDALGYTWNDIEKL